MNRIDKINKYKYYYALTDFMVLSISFMLTLYAMVAISDLRIENVITPVIPLVIFLFMLSILFIFEFNQLYTVDVIRSRNRQLSAVVKSLAAGGAYIFFLTIVLISVNLTEIGILILAFTTISFSLLYVVRIEILRSVLLKEKVMVKNILIAGDGHQGVSIAEQLSSVENSGIKITGFLDNRLNPGEEVINGISSIGKVDDIENVINSYNVDEVIISFDSLTYAEIFEISDKCLKLNVRTKIASKLFDVIPQNFKTHDYYGIPVVDLTPGRTSVELKRFMDVILSLSGIIILSPILLIIAALVKLTSKGPVLYKQKRVGLNGQTFDFYKFRSMTVDDNDDEQRKEMMLRFMKNNADQAQSTKVINRNRLTPIGAIIRKYSLDELPQLFNVIKGDMSLVGPRPSLPYEYENYEDWQKKRVEVIPGCTGVWQVAGRSQVSFNESILLDLYYMSKMSVWFDFKIILKTIPVMILSKGGE